jgi:hypothetical protein
VRSVCPLGGCFEKVNEIGLATAPTVAVGSQPTGVAVNQRTDTIYVANSNEQTVGGVLPEPEVTWASHVAPVNDGYGARSGNEEHSASELRGEGGDRLRASTL